MKIICSRVIPEVGLNILRDAGHEVDQYTEQKPLTTDILIKLCQPYNALLSATSTALNEEFFNACKHLKAISLLSVGHDNVDARTATKYKIPVGNTPDVVSAATADIAFLLILAVSRKAIFHYNRIVQDQWHFTEPTAFLGKELEKKTLGIFGLGRIGLDLATKIKAAYHMDIIYHNRNRNPEAEKLLDARYVSFEALLAQSDVLSVHTNLSSETKAVFNMEAFRKMKPSAIFINTARGGIHDEADLIKALDSGILWGAGLDVTNPEPMHKENPLLRHPNVCVLPHIGTATEETRGAMAQRAATNIVTALKGEKMPYCINPEIYNS